MNGDNEPKKDALQSVSGAFRLIWVDLAKQTEQPINREGRAEANRMVLEKNLH